MKKLWLSAEEERVEKDKELFCRLQDIVDKPMRYDELCRALDMPKKSSDSKTKQLNDLQMYCDLEQTAKPTRYIVHKVYDKQLAALGLLSANNKYQLAFEAVMYQKFLDEGGEAIHMSNMELVELFGEVNQNFRYACNYSVMKELGYEDMTDDALELYKIIKRWTARRLKQMENRMVIISRNGFRLYKTTRGDGGKIESLTTYNVPANSGLEKRCQQIYDRAVAEIMPPNWDEIGGWVDYKTYQSFERRIRQLAITEFDGEYDNLRHVRIISPPTEEWMQEKIIELYNQIDTSQIADHSREAVMTSRQFDNRTDEQKRLFVEYNINANPPVNFRAELNKKKEERA